MLDQLTRRIETLVDGREPIGFDVRFDLGESGSIFVAGKAAPITVDTESREADTVFRIAAADLLSMLDGELAPMMAYMQGKLKVDGDLGQALQLTRIFD